MPDRTQRAPSRETPSRAEAPSTAERILDVAERCFARKGFAGTTLRDVAEGVGIRIPSLYNHFDGKESLYAAVLARGMTPILDLLARSIASGDDDAGTDPRALVRDVMALLGERPELPRLVQYELLAGGDHLASVLESWLRPTFARSLELLQQSPAVQAWKPEQLPALLLALLDMILGHFAMAPLFASLLGERADDEAAIARATEVYGEIAFTLVRGMPSAAGARPVRTPDQEPRT